MHHIQRKIIRNLMHAPALGYAEMRPKGIESNHFAYHLDQLVRAGLITKQDRSYTLTIEGLALADRVSHDKMVVKPQPQIVTSICVTNDHGQTLLFKHAFRPYLNLRGFPQGRVHYDERITDAANRELTEKTNLKDIPLTYRGMVYIHTSKEGEDVSKLLAHVFSGAVKGAPLLGADTEKGSSAWEDASQYAPAECMPGFWEITKLLADHANDLFFAEIDAHLI